jgi:hypothetical protein
VYKRFGESVSLECTSKGVPPPELTWRKVNDFTNYCTVHRKNLYKSWFCNFKDGSPLRPRSGIVLADSLMIINELQATDEGLYECEASNIAGSRNHMMRLHVTGKVVALLHLSGLNSVKSESDYLTLAYAIVQCTVGGHQWNI